MTRTTSRSLLATVLALIVYAALSDRPAQALVTYTSPYGATVPVTVYFGSCNQAGLSCTRVVWVRRSDNACTAVKIADGAGLTDTTRVIGSSGNDVFTSVSGATSTPCGGLGTPNYNGHSMAFYGGAGNDLMFNYNSGDTWLVGEGAGDILYSYGVGGVTGGDGDDLINVNGAFSNEYVKGDNGNDCMYDATASALTFDCGAGTDKASSNSTGHVPAVMIHCETITSTNGC